MKNTLNIPLSGVAPGLPVTDCCNLKAAGGGTLRAVDPEARNIPVRHDALVVGLLDNQPADLTPPDIFLRTVAAGTASETIAAMSLTDTDFTRDSPRLSDKGAALLSQQLLDAYSRLSQRVCDSRLFFQPVMGRLHLLDSAGNRLWSSAPQLLESDGFQCCSTIALTCTKDGTNLKTPAATLTASCYRMEAVVASLGAYTDAVSVEVTISPQIHPVDFAASAPARLTRTDTTSPGLTVAIPGTTDNFADRSEARIARVKALMPRLSWAELRAALSGSAMPSFPVGNSLSLDLSGENRVIAAALGKSVAANRSESASVLRRISAPGGFRANVATVSGNAVAWGDITVLLSPPELPRNHSDSPASGILWEGILRLNLADGTTRSRLIGSPMPLPEALPSLIAIPDPEAVSVELWVRRTADGSISHACVQLSASEEGTSAIAVSSSLLPVTLTAGDGAWPQADTAVATEGMRYPGAVVTATMERPYAPQSVHLVTSEPIVALHPAVKSVSSWDFTRARLYAFSPAGIFTVAFSPSQNRPASALIDPQGVSRGAATAYTSSGIMAVTDGGVLLRVAGAHTERLLDNVGADSLGWFIPADELHMTLSATGAVSALDLRSSQIHTLRAGEDSGLVPVRWTVRMPLLAPRRVASLRFAMSASRFNGKILLRGDSGAGQEASRPLLTLAIDGEVNAPVCARVIAHPCSFVTLSVEGTASPDMTVTDIRLNLI